MKNFYSIIAIVVFTFLLQYQAIDCSFNNDTYATFNEIERTNINSIKKYLTFDYLFNYKNYGNQSLANDLEKLMPIYYIISKPFLLLEGEEQLGYYLTLLSILLITFSTGFIYQSAKYISNSHSASIAGLMILTNPLLYYHGLNIRFYSLLIFLSSLAVYQVIRLRNEFSLKQTTLFFVTLSLLLAVHVTSVLIVIICLVCFLNFNWKRLDSQKKIKMLSLCGLIFAPTLPNFICFIYARLHYDGSNNIMSESFISFVSSMIFNYGTGVLLIIFLSCKKLLQDPNLRVAFIVLTIEVLLIIILASFRYDLLRPDYFVSLLPLIILLSIASLSFIKEQKFVIAILVTIIILPTTISNLFIDQDRLNYKQLLVDINNKYPSKPITIYTLGQLNFPKKLPVNITVKNLNIYKNDSYKRDQLKIYAIPWKRQGFSKRFVVFNDLESIYNDIFKTSEFIGTSGKNRLDMKDNLFFLYKSH